MGHPSRPGRQGCDPADDLKPGRLKRYKSDSGADRSFYGISDAVVSEGKNAPKRNQSEQTDNRLGPFVRLFVDGAKSSGILQRLIRTSFSSSLRKVLARRLFRNDRRHVFVRRNVSGVVHFNALRCGALAETFRDFFRRPLLNRNIGTRLRIQVDRGQRARHIKGMPWALARTATPYVPILLATSPFAATRSVPTITACIQPFDMTMAAMLSANSVTSMPACWSSKAVRRAPCRTGLVSSANTLMFRPCSWARYIGARAVPYLAVANPLHCSG